MDSHNQDSTPPPDAAHHADPAPPPLTAPSADTAPRRPSRAKAWLGMGAVVIALALLWIASPGPVHDDFEQAVTGGNPGEPEDAAAEGKPARLDFTLQDINGVDVKLASFKGK